ncbi:capsular polysaccharide biosynthesis protein, partial [Yersinia pestis]
LFLENLNNTTIKFGCIQSLDQFDPKEAEKVSFALIAKFKNYLPLSIQH